MRASTWPFFTGCPSVNSMLSSRPETCGSTVTVLSACTVPSAVRYTGTFCLTTGTTVTGTGGASPPLPLAPFAAPSPGLCNMRMPTTAITTTASTINAIFQKRDMWNSWIEPGASSRERPSPQAPRGQTCPHGQSIGVRQPL